MKLTFDINPETFGITLSTRFDSNDTSTGLQGKIRVFNYLKDIIEGGGNLTYNEKANVKLAKLQVKIEDYTNGLNPNTMAVLRSASKIVKKYGNFIDEDLRNIMWKCDTLVLEKDESHIKTDLGGWQSMADENIEELRNLFLKKSC